MRISKLNIENLTSTQMNMKTISEILETFNTLSDEGFEEF